MNIRLPTIKLVKRNQLLSKSHNNSSDMDAVTTLQTPLDIGADTGI